MLRTLFQCYVRDSLAAADAYREAFGATVMSPPGPVFYSELMTEFVDRFGVRWCLFV